jgi:sec-independent protein translocase protein TatA
MLISHFADILGLGTPELLLVLVILILLFGAAKLPQLAKSVGLSMKELRKGMHDDEQKPKQTTADKAEKQS